jgi:hypothetical protein
MPGAQMISFPRVDVSIFGPRCCFAGRASPRGNIGHDIMHELPIPGMVEGVKTVKC